MSAVRKPLPACDALSIDACVADAGADYVDIEIAETSRCTGCAGTCMWTLGGSARPVRLRGTALRAGSTALGAGDRVRVEMPADALLTGTLLVHGLPLAALLAGGALGAFATGSDAGCLLGAAGGLGAVLALTPSLRARAERLTVERVRIEPLQ